MFIVEGPDGAGKTTLIQRLQKELKFDVMPRPCTSDQGVDPSSLANWVNEDLSRPVHSGGFYDRYPLISEPIYGPLIRGQVATRFDDVKWFMDRLTMLQARNPVIVYCLPPRAEVLKNVDATHTLETDHLQGVNRMIGAIYDQYCVRAACDSLAFDVWVWDYTKEDADKDFLDLLEIAEGNL